MIISSTLSLILGLLISLVLAILVLSKPYLGLVFTIASQPVADVLPDIPIVSSIVVILGAVTILGFLLKAKRENVKFAFRFSTVHILSLLLIMWLFISHPQAAWSGSGRNWVFTFLQLFLLLWLAGFLLNSPQKHWVLMWVVSLLSIVSAFVAIQQGGGAEIDPDVRVAGLAQGSNTATRYFVIAFVFLTYLRSIERHNLVKLLLVAGMIIAFIGVFYTASRTGILLLMIAIILLILLQSGFRYRVQLVFISVIGLALILVFSASIIDFIQGIFPSISQGTDTVGVRYALWEAGFQMWLDHPITGVGIGMFAPTLHLYPNPAYPLFFSQGTVAHNMYVSMLAETGLVGALLFVVLIIASLMNFIKSQKLPDPRYKAIRNTWAIVLIILLIGGITKTDQVDKFMWLTFGTSVFFDNLVHFSFKRTQFKNSKPLLFAE